MLPDLTLGRLPSAVEKGNKEKQIMKITTKSRTPSWVRRGTLSLLCAAASLTLFGSNLRSRGAEEDKLPTAEDVKELQKQYETERDAITGSDLAKKFSPQAIKQAETIAKKGTAALKAGRIMQAREAFRQARWVLPAVPLDLPENV